MSFVARVRGQRGRISWQETPTYVLHYPQSHRI